MIDFATDTWIILLLTIAFVNIITWDHASRLQLAMRDNLDVFSMAPPSTQNTARERAVNYSMSLVMKTDEQRTDDQ